MPFKFQWLCELLEELQKNRYQRATTAPRSQNPDHRTLLVWFNRYDHKIERNGKSAAAFLSSIFPERRVDRVYNLQEKRLSPLFGRALGLGSSRAADLNGWRERDGDDFAVCVERVMRQCEFDVPSAGREVTLEEIDAALHQIAANSPFSSPTVKAAANDGTAEDCLRPILRRLQSSEAKWLIRLMFKSFRPVQIPEYFTMKQFHFMLPDLLTLQNSLDAAVRVLAKSTISILPPRPNRQYEQALRPLIAREITPELGIMVRRQPYHKARSIKHCCKVVNKRQMSVERKYDGEYCQIHIDMLKGSDCVKIFSKSGKDSTNDRLRLHAVIKDSLRLDLDGCKIRSQCVIEGELLVWSLSKKEILPFHKIRKHVRHGGRYIGTAQDSPVTPDEELMIVYYDLLILDDKLLLNEPHTTRRQHLKALVRNIEGRSMIGERRIIDFNSSRASTKLREAFAHSITHLWEGLVLKACDEAFFSFGSKNHGIKLKKDYINGLGDSADLCLVGGRRDARVEQDIGLGPLRWTSFHVGCLTNKDDVIRYNAKPRLKIIDELTTHSMPNSELLDLNRLGRLFETSFTTSMQEYDLDIDPRFQKNPSELFKQPFVVEIMGAGFERLSNSSSYALRFPRKIDRKVKIHTDRNLTDTISFAELQELARQSLEMSEVLDTQEDAEWIEKLIRADGKVRNTQNTTQSTSSTRTPQSAAAMSISPVYRRKASVPLLYVRADTEDRETPERESFALTSGCQSLPLPKSRLEQDLHTRQTAFVPLMNISSDPVVLRSNTSLSQAWSLHVNEHEHEHGYKRSRQCLEPLVPKPKQDKRRRLASSRAETISKSESQAKLSVMIDLTSPAKEISTERRLLAAMNGSLTPSTTHNTINLVSPTYVQPPANAVNLFSLDTLDESGPHRMTNTEQAGQPTSRSSCSVYGSLIQSSANISRKLIAKQIPRAQNLDATQKASLKGFESHFLADLSATADNGTITSNSVCTEGDVETRQEVPPTSVSSAEVLRARTVDANKIVQNIKKSHSTVEGLGKLSFKLAGPMFITDSLYNLKTRSQKGLNNMLQGLRINITFSVEHFLDNIDNGIASTTSEQRYLHVMLINFRDIEGAKTDVEEVFEHLVFRARRSLAPGSTETNLEQRLLKSYSNTILIFDYKVLSKCEAGELNVDVLKALSNTDEGAAMFGGIIKIDNKKLRLGREPRYVLLTDWSWAD